MNLSELKIETYSDQLSEKDLTEVKGGTGTSCIETACDVACGVAFASLGVLGLWMRAVGSTPSVVEGDIPQ